MKQKRAEIHFSTIDNKENIIVWDFKNILSKAELISKNMVVYKMYTDGAPYFFHGISQSGCRRYIRIVYLSEDKKLSEGYIFKDSVILRERFAELVRSMKKAGDRLHKLLKEIDGAEKKVIRI